MNLDTFLPQPFSNAEGRIWTREDARYVKDSPATWTREDARYVKDSLAISPVTYPTRVAPLPEDRLAGEERVKEEVEQGNEQLERERRTIEADNRLIRRIHRVEEEKLPYPTLIKVEQTKKEKVVYDLKEAIQLVKVGVCFSCCRL